MAREGGKEIEQREPPVPEPEKGWQVGSRTSEEARVAGVGRGSWSDVPRAGPEHGGLEGEGGDENFGFDFKPPEGGRL